MVSTLSSAGTTIECPTEPVKVDRDDEEMGVCGRDSACSRCSHRCVFDPAAGRTAFSC